MILTLPFRLVGVRKSAHVVHWADVADEAFGIALARVSRMSGYKPAAGDRPRRSAHAGSACAVLVRFPALPRLTRHGENATGYLVAVAYNCR